jgi:hypothetical protein
LGDVVDGRLGGGKAEDPRQHYKKQQHDLKTGASTGGLHNVILFLDLNRASSACTCLSQINPGVST